MNANNSFTHGCLKVTVKHLFRKPSGLCYFRLVIPKDLQDCYDAKTQIFCSLKTDNLQQAIPKIQGLTLKYKTEFANLRNSNERDKAVRELKSYGLEDSALDRQSIYMNGTHPNTEGGPYERLRVDYSAIADIGGGFDNSRLEDHQQRALDILNGDEKFTLTDVKNRTLKMHVGNKIKTHEINRSFGAFGGGALSHPLDRIRTKDVMLARDHLLLDKKTATVKKMMQFVGKQVREFIIEQDLTIRNPFEGVTIPNMGKDVRKRESLEPSELQLVRSCVEKADSKVFSSMFVGLLFNTGCRPNEVGGLHLSDIDLEHDVPHIKITEHPNRALKNTNSDRLIPLVGISLDIATKLKANVTDSDQVYLFPHYNKANKYNNATAVTASTKWLKNKVGKTTYGLRHSFRDRLFDAGVSSHEIENLMGWSTGKMINHYGKSQGLSRLSEALNQMLTFEKKFPDV